MARCFSRREFLRISTYGLLGLGGLLYGGEWKPLTPKRLDPDIGIELDDNDSEVGFHEAAQLALLLGKAGDILGLDHWRPSVSEDTYEAWIIEVLLQMHADKIIDTITLPARPYFFDPLEETDPLYKIGVSDCLITAQLSNRILNPMSPWYNSPDWPGTAVHENVHRTLQRDLCNFADSDKIENAANVIMLVELASMANRGNGFAFRSFVWESLDICLGAAFFLAYQSNRLDDYQALRSAIHPGILSRSRFEKINREYAGNEFERFQRLAKYNLKPLTTIMKAHLTNRNLVNNLYLTPRRVYSAGTNYNNAPSSEQRIISVYDWIWAMSHLEDTAIAFANLPEVSILR